ncbi:glycoside hydrolase family 5 protein [Diplogelasinospora grovesii]|uniref:Endoglucanase EG-II n=1 Tax=Diplogelasinospora grovesii TaxID=303347 RepID=A0AAN6S325_9PEZI|nr:glycoside hydrolase family 5 protein [Diplogelasinospora grovesii]
MFTFLLTTLAVAGRALAAPVAERADGVQFIGTNIAGFDFGCSIQGACNLTQATPPLSSLGGPDGAGQMQHFVKDDGMNMFRLPVGWQYLINNKLGGTLDSGNLGRYDQLVQACLATGAYCIVDIHNYARWNGQIIGQGGPTNDQFVNLWTQIATKYASQSKMVFGVMNEPHDVPDINKWADTVQAVVTAIRGAGAKNQMILLPGNDWTSAAAMPTKSGPALLKVKNPDGSTDGLIFDVHKYLDSDNSGTHTECVTDNISGAFQPLATWLRTNKRQALNSETGGGNTASCQKYLCAQIQFLNQNTDVFLGYTGWSAGAFNPQTYELSEVPAKNGNSWTDTSLVKACIKKQ